MSKNAPQKLVIVDPNNRQYVNKLENEMNSGGWFVASMAPYGDAGSNSFLCVLEKKVEIDDKISVKSSKTLKDTLEMLNKKEPETV